jgi:hypothetical protein
VKKYASGVDGRRNPLEAEFNESGGVPQARGSGAAPEATPPKRKRRARGEALTPSLCDRICGGIAKGLFPEEAAKLAGVHAQTFESWIKKGTKGTEPFATLVAAIAQAEARLESALTGAFLAGSEESWQAARDMAARRFPTRWSDHAARLAVLGPDDIGLGGDGGLRITLNLNVFKREEPEAVSPQRAIDVTPSKPPPKDPDPSLN